MRPSFATFWAGSAMQALDKACLASFAASGYDVKLYSYEAVSGLPRGVLADDARLVAPEDSLGAFRYQGKPNLSHFSDYFRYRMFARTDQAWIDADMLLLRPITINLSGSLFAKETARSICGAIMHIGRDDPMLGAIIARTEGLMGQELVWGATGPRLLSQLVGKKTILERAESPASFFPIHFDDFYKPLLPRFRQECERRCQSAFSLHLWNNIVEKLGYWKEIAPPEGSFLWHQLERQGTLGLFRDIYPVGVMESMVTNWLFRKSGGDIGAVKLARQIIPSILRTTGPRIRALAQMRRR